MHFKLLKFVYNGLLSGMPFIAYNPITKTPIHVPFTIKEQSTYINYKLSNIYTHELNEYIHKYDPNMDITPIKLLSNEEAASPYLSVNVYNCSSPIFFNENNDITRFEINTYIRKWNSTTNSYSYGTLILDYTSNELSMDPINIFKPKEDLRFVFENSHINEYVNQIDCTSIKDDIYFNLSLIPWYYSSTESSPNLERKQIHDDLIQYSDAIYYKNGIYDKLYYDSSLINAPIHFPYVVHKNANFYYRGMIFEKPDHVFFFEKPIFFVGGMWENIFTLEDPSENEN